MVFIRSRDYRNIILGEWTFCLSASWIFKCKYVIIVTLIDNWRVFCRLVPTLAQVTFNYNYLTQFKVFKERLDIHLSFTILKLYLQGILSSYSFPGITVTDTSYLRHKETQCYQIEIISFDSPSANKITIINIWTLFNRWGNVITRIVTQWHFSLEAILNS